MPVFEYYLIGIATHLRHGSICKD